MLARVSPPKLHRLRSRRYPFSPREQRVLFFCDHCALNEKGELTCKGEAAEVASSAKQAISILAMRAKCKTYLNYMLFKANFQVKLCNYVAINTNFLECCFLLL